MTLLFSKCITEDDELEFKKIWDEIRELDGLECSPFTDNGDRYFIDNEEGIHIGTIEFFKYSPDEYLKTPEYYQFPSHPFLIKNKSSLIYEVRKVGFREKYRHPKNLKLYLSLIFNYAELKSIDYYLCVIGLQSFRIYKNRFKLDVRALEEPIPTHHNPEILIVPCILIVKENKKIIQEKFIQDQNEFTNIFNLL